jgi:hypothetical protein
MTIDNGNVGIGTTSPSAKLEVSDSNTTKTAIHIDNTSTGGNRWDIASIGSGVSGRVGNLQIRNDSDTLNIVEITEAGNVGIGTTDPGARLHAKTGSSNGSAYQSSVGLIVEGATRSIIQVNSTTDAYMMFGDATTLNKAWVGYNHTVDQLSLHTGGTITMNGNVGIGTTNPGEKLDVDGTVKAQGYKSSDGTAGITGTMTFTDKDSITRTITYKNGLVVGTTPAPPS